MALPLDLFADLQLAVDGERIDLRARGKRIVVDVPSLRAARRLLEAQPLSDALRGRATRRVQEALQGAGFTMEVQLNGAPVAVVGAGASPGRLARMMRLGGVELRPASTLRQAARRRPFATVLLAGGLAAVLGWALVRLFRS